MTRRLFRFLISLALCQTVLPAAHAQTLTILHRFADGSVQNDGQNPDVAVIQGSDGNFYGTTAAGGSAGEGTVFKVTLSGAETILHNFGDGSIQNDGEDPEASLIKGNDGNFYGTTSDGGFDGGTVFKVTSAGAVSILHDFGDGTVQGDGVYPKAPLVLGSDGDFYGTTTGGGSGGNGTVFKMTPAGAVTVLHEFGDGTVANDGTDPEAALVQGNDGNFYGTTNTGGSTAATDPNHNGYGTIFKITPAGVVTILHSFGDGSIQNDGSCPIAALVEGNDGNYYGVTFDGGANAMTSNGGTIFKTTPSGSVTILHRFGDGSVMNDGSHPAAAMIKASDGNFYGTTETGGVGNGNVFKMTPGGAETVLYSFGGGSVQNDGVYPIASLVQGSDGSLYGTTYLGGGSANGGTVFRLTVPGLTPALTWNARDVAAAPDGTSRMLWTRSDGEAGLWIMSASDAQSAVGPTYGPYTGWSAKAVSVAGDRTSRVLWTNTNGEAGVWTFSASGTETAIGPTYGPYAGWTATDLAAESNGTSRVLWTNANGEAGVWTFNAADTQTTVGPTYGPYTGWTAKAVGVASDGTSRVLWTNTNGQAGVWSFSAANAETAIGKTYGPYTGWSATDLGTSSDGTSNVLWTNVSGAAGVWTFSAADVETMIGTTYGPYSGYTAAALDSSSDQSRVLWVNASRAAGIWTFGATDAESVIGATYGPY